MAGMLGGRTAARRAPDQEAGMRIAAATLPFVCSPVHPVFPPRRWAACLAAVAADAEHTQSTTVHPRKRFFRARAHSNPLNDFSFDVPARPEDADW